MGEATAKATGEATAKATGEATVGGHRGGYNRGHGGGHSRGHRKGTAEAIATLGFKGQVRGFQACGVWSCNLVIIRSDQSFSRVRLFATP